MNLKTLTLILFFIHFISFSAYSDLTKANQLAQEGKQAAAFTEYTQWLKINTASEKYGEIILKAAESAPTIKEGMDLLQSALPRIKISAYRLTILIYLAEYAELSGDIESAQKYYEEAGGLAADKQHDALQLQSARLLQYMGRYDESKTQLDSIIKGSSSDSSFYYKAYLFLAKYYLIKGNRKAFSTALEALKKNKGGKIPMVNYFLEYMKINKDLNLLFPQSPETLLAAGRINSLPNTETVFGLAGRTEIQNTTASPPVRLHFYIQTGSFRDSENAGYMSKDLNNLGFKTFVEKQNVGGITYFKVLLDAKDPQDVQKLILRLKDKGFEGYPIY